MTFGEYVSETLKSEGRTVKWLSETTGVNLNTLYAITKRKSDNVSADIRTAVYSAIGEPPTFDQLQKEAYKQGFKDAINFMLKVHEEMNKYTAMQMKHKADSILKYVEMKGRYE